MKIKKSIVLVFIMILLDSSLIAQSDTSFLKNQIMKLEMAHAAAIFKGDAAALDTLMDDNVTVNHPTNRIVNEKQELLNLINAGVIRYSSFDRYPEKFLFFKNMIVVMGREIVVPAESAPNAGKTLQRRYTNLWMNKDGKWRLTVRHANNICGS